MKYNITVRYKNYKGDIIVKDISINDYWSAVHALNCTEKKSDQVKLLKTLTEKKILTSDQAKKLKDIHAPSKAKVKQIRAKVAARKAVESTKEYQDALQKEIDRMIAHPGFMSCSAEHQ
jgi:hypothetical protein